MVTPGVGEGTGAPGGVGVGVGTPAGDGAGVGDGVPEGVISAGAEASPLPPHAVSNTVTRPKLATRRWFIKSSHNISKSEEMVDLRNSAYNCIKV
jgi:hypothetical protein